VLFKADEICAWIEGTAAPCDPDDPLCVVPKPNLDELKKSGTASLDLRLGRWFLMLRQDRTEILEVHRQNSEKLEPYIARRIFVPFGNRFVLHPRSFVLGCTLEWIRLPSSIGGYVFGKSSWGRRGLVIETAPGVHPGFSGCLTLEMSNVGTVPLAIQPGIRICQIAFQSTRGDSAKSEGIHIGMRRPDISLISSDEVAEKLSEPL